MVVKAVTNIADEAKIRFGWMVLILGAAFLAGSIAFFFSEDVQVMGMDLSGDEDTFGWYFMALSMVFSFSGLFLAISVDSPDV